MSDRRRSVRLAAAVSSILSAPAIAVGAGLVMALATAPLAQAQETTSSIRGTITQPDGSPAVGATVRITDTRTGNSRAVTTSESGQFAASGLRVGGPYTVQVDASGLAPQTITDITLGLGDTYTFEVALSPETLQTVTVTGSAIYAVQVALGPSKTFTLADLEDAPAINRNINDVISIDPRIYVDEAFNDSVQCAGANPRFNALTVDGVLLSDNFGLNSNGYPTERMPFPYDAIEQVSVELAPFDVKYGGFTACNINAVTKSGSNRFTGSVFYDYTDDSLQGDKLQGDSIDLGSFEEKRYGASIGGPIIKDRLFFFAAYEKLKGANIFTRGPADASVAVPVLGVTQAQLDLIAQIARDVYGYDPGGFPPSLATDDEKYIVKLDWNINDLHRASYTYSYNDGFNNSEADDDSDQIEFANHFYERGAELEGHVVQLFSNWTENFSTEFRYSYQKLDNRQLSLAGTDFGEVQIHTFNDPDGPGGISPQRATVFLGADDSRHANDLKYDTTGYKLAATWTLGDHTISAGLEREELDVFNMFIQEAEGEYLFTSESVSGSNPFQLCSASNPNGCIEAFRTGNPNRITYENASPSNIPTDAAAQFGYEINTFYAQDEFPVGPVTVVAGLRYDWYTSNDTPKLNSNFVLRNGYSNQGTFDGKSLLQPRLGLNWDVSNTLSVRGGFGLYSGGNPNVWLANGFQNDGQTQREYQNRLLDNDGLGGATLFNIPFNGDGDPIFDIPQCLFDQVGGINSTVPGCTPPTAGNGGVNALDPNFKVPKEWKFALGATWDFDAGPMGDGYRLMFDYLHTEKEDSAIIVDATLEQIRTAPDGRPIYKSIDRSDPDCLVNPAGAACSNREFSQDFILTNVKGGDGESDVYSLALSKSYDWGLDWTLAYAYTDSTEVSPMTSSVAFSNYANISVSDPNDPGVTTSNYNIKNRYTLVANYRRAFFGDNETKITLYGRVNEGRSYSPVFVDAGNIYGDRIDDRHLLYIPTGPSDPKVVFGAGFDQAAFFAYLDSVGLSKYAGRVAPRNSIGGDWWNKWDLRISQELPSFIEGHKFSAFVVIENLGNFIDDDWGVFSEQAFPGNEQLVGMTLPVGGTQYNYNTFVSPPGPSRVADPSLWEVRFGINYSF